MRLEDLDLGDYLDFEVVVEDIFPEDDGTLRVELYERLEPSKWPQGATVANESGSVYRVIRRLDTDDGSILWVEGHRGREGAGGMSLSFFLPPRAARLLADAAESGLERDRDVLGASEIELLERLIASLRA